VLKVVHSAPLSVEHGLRPFPGRRPLARDDRRRQ
jgi:hypothetical protein